MQLKLSVVRYWFYGIVLSLGIAGLYIQYWPSPAELTDQERERIAWEEEELRKVRARELEHAAELARRDELEAQKARRGTIATLKPEIWTLTVLPADEEGQSAVAAVSALNAADPQKPQQYSDFLAHEIVRQAWLIALRDGLGMAIRDGSLAESLPAETVPDPQTLRQADLEIHARVARDQVEVVLMRRTEGQPPVEVWRRQTPADEKPAVDYLALLKLAEQWSREDFVEALKQQGLAARTPKPPSDAALAQEIAEQLDRINELDQFLAIRRLHRALEEQGTSSQLIGGLVRAYANLGLLTEFHWSQAHKAIQARAALYAQRLCRKQPDSPWGLWHRSYALALAGLHKQALDDREAAARLAADATDESKAETPLWAEAASAFCRFDSDRLAELSAGEQHKQLAGMLHYLTVESDKTPSYTIDAGMAALRANPVNFRIVDSLCDVGGIGNLHRLTQGGPAVLTGVLLRRLPEAPGLPEQLAETLSSAAQQQQVDEASIVQQLSTAGQADHSEPNWSAYAQIISETHFVHVWRRAYFMRFQWSVPTEEYLQQSWPLVAEHRHRQYIEQMMYDVDRTRETAVDILPRLDQLALPPSKQALVAALMSRCGISANERNSLLYQHSLRCDEVYSELAGLSRMLLGLRQVLPRLEAISPYGLDTAVCQARMGSIDDMLAKFPLDQSHPPAVLRVLAYRLAQPKYQDKWRQVLQAYIPISPDFWAYRRLADIYKDEGDLAKWRELLDEYLKTTEPTLEHAQVRVDIARDFMSRREWQQAEPYAAEAATSYAAWAMHCAVECYEGMGDLTQAQLWFARLAERYPRHAPQYAAWCEKHGLEAPKGIADANLQQLEMLIDQLPPEQLDVLGSQFLLRGEWESALAVFQKGHVVNKDARARCLNGMFTALLAVQLKKPELRDDTLRDIAKTSNPAQIKSRQLAEWMQRALAAEKDAEEGAPLDMAAVDALLAEASIEDRVNLNYFAGRFLELHGHSPACRQYYSAAVDVKGGETYLAHRLAKAALEATAP